jgi:hypothetical protein
MNVAIARRIREHAIEHPGKILTMHQALDPKRGYALGLLNLDGKITAQQHDIGLKVAGDMARYYGLTGVPFPSARAQNLFAIRSDGEDSESRGEAARKASAKMASIRATLLAVGDIDTGRRVYRAVMSVVVEDIQECRGWPEHMLLYLRKGLNKAGAVVYGM